MEQLRNGKLRTKAYATCCNVKGQHKTPTAYSKRVSQGKVYSPRLGSAELARACNSLVKLACRFPPANMIKCVLLPTFRELAQQLAMQGNGTDFFEQAVSLH